VYDDPASLLPKRDSIQGVVVIRVWTTRFGRYKLAGRAFDYLTFYLSAAWALLILLRRGDTVVAKTDPPLVSVVAAVVANICGARLINWTQDLFPEVAQALGFGGGKLVTSLLRRLRNWSLRAASVNVAIGEAMARRLAHEGIQRATIRVIHNWADGQTIHPVERPYNDLRKVWALEEKFVVGYSGNMGRAHEFATILDAAERLSDWSDIVFLFIGDGPQRKWVWQQVQQRKLENVCFRPYQPRERLAMSLGVPDVHLISLQPSLEGLIVPSKFYGIAAAGRATFYIGDPNGEVAGILKEADCGRSFVVGDAHGLADAILEVRHKPELLRHWEERARRIFDDSFSQDRALLAWERLLRPVADNLHMVLPVR
jgi:glycosyltransferase involved in cell wall biosynthesis